MCLLKVKKADLKDFGSRTTESDAPRLCGENYGPVNRSETSLRITCIYLELIRSFCLKI